jgi:hypothetical protein
MNRTKSLRYIWLTIDFLLLLPIVLLGCTQPQPEKPREITGINYSANLLIFFKLDATDDQIMYFWDEVLGTPRKDGRGINHKPGINGVTASVSVDGHRSVTVSFWPTATSEEKSRVVRDVMASPIVFKVLTDTVPSSVKSIE